MRADRLLKTQYPGLRNRHIDEAFDAGWISLSGKVISKGTKVALGECLETEKLAEHLTRLRLGNPTLAIPLVRECEGYVIIDKPAGLKSQPLSLFDRDTVTHWVFHRYPETRTAFPEEQPEMVVHRLDRGTSGVQIVALDRTKYDAWRALFDDKQVEKTYLAWACGVAERAYWSLDRPLVPAGSDKVRLADGRDANSSRLPAVSEIRVLQQRQTAFLAQVRCKTGVRHQVRAHLAGIGHPLVGDQTYAAPTIAGFDSNHHLLRAIQLKSPIGQFEVTGQDFESLPIP